IVEANLLAWKEKTSPGTVVNLSGGSSVSVNEILSIIGRLTGKRLNVRNLEKVPGDVFRTGGSTSKAADVLGLKAVKAIEDALKSECRWPVGKTALEGQSGRA